MLKRNKILKTVKLACQLEEIQYDIVKNQLKQSFKKICGDSVVIKMSTCVVADFSSPHK